MNKNYFFAVGRRKTASARVKLTPGKGDLVVNETKIEKISDVLMQPLVLTGNEKKFDITAKTIGGGFNSQTEAIRLGIARCLIKYSPELKTTLKKAGLLTRDPREKERKKPGLKRARKAPQWSKR